MLIGLFTILLLIFGLVSESILISFKSKKTLKSGLKPPVVSDKKKELLDETRKELKG
jgi:hypothetical protein